MTYHDAEVVIDPKVPAVTVEEVHRGEGTFEDELYRDPRWPTHCKCGYRFHPEEHWQHNVTRLYEGSPDRKLYVLRGLPPGAMWDATWLKDTSDLYVGPDGKAWCIMLPGGVEWIVYGPSGDGRKWDVKGTPPEITVFPSINHVGVYHGNLKNGILGEDSEGRKFEGIQRTV